MYANDILNKSSRIDRARTYTQTNTHAYIVYVYALELVMNMIFCKPHTNLDGYPFVLGRLPLSLSPSLSLSLPFPFLSDFFLRSIHLSVHVICCSFCLSIKDVVKVEYMLANATNKNSHITITCITKSTDTRRYKTKGERESARAAVESKNVTESA